MYPELLKSPKEGPTIPIHFSLSVSKAGGLANRPEENQAPGILSPREHLTAPLE